MLCRKAYYFGAQCSNYYRTLLVKGVLKDSNYHVENGKAVYLFSTKKDKDGRVIMPKVPNTSLFFSLLMSF